MDTTAEASAGSARTGRKEEQTWRPSLWLATGAVVAASALASTLAWIANHDATDAAADPPSLAGSTLIRADLQAATLEAADFTGSELTGADLRFANLRGSRFDRVDANKADFSAACLAGTTWHGANLTGAKLEGADLSGADLSRVDLTAVEASIVVADANTRWPIGNSPLSIAETRNSPCAQSP